MNVMWGHTLHYSFIWYIVHDLPKVVIPHAENAALHSKLDWGKSMSVLKENAVKVLKLNAVLNIMQ